MSAEILNKLANVQPIDKVLRQQWIDAVKQEGIAAQEMTIFWTDFLKKNHVNSRYQANYAKIIGFANQLQTFTVDTDLNQINSSLIGLSNAIEHKNITRDCALAGWVDLQTGIWHNHVAENAVLIYTEYARAYISKSQEEQELHKKVIANLNPSANNIERNNPF